MLDAKLMARFGTLMLAGGLLVGCPADDDDATGDDDATDATTPPDESPAESPEPEELAFESGDVSYDCEGSAENTTDWTFSMVNSGWAWPDDSEGLAPPTVIVFDNFDAGYVGGDPSNAYCEVHTLELLSEEPDWMTGTNIQQWQRILDYVATAGEVVEDESTTFRCGEGWDTELTYKFCAYDENYDTGLYCVLIGKFAAQYEDETCDDSASRSLKPWWQF